MLKRQSLPILSSVAVAVCSAAALAQEFTLRGPPPVCTDESPLVNYSGALRKPCDCFLPNEQAGVVFTAPAAHYPIEILRVGIGWYSPFGGAPASQEFAVHIYGAGLPNPGAPIFTKFGPPPLIDGIVNVIDLEPEPGQIIHNAGPFTATLEFLNQTSGNPFAPDVADDQVNCTAGRNVVFVIPGGWNDACPLGVNGNWVFEAVYRSLNCTATCGNSCADIDGSGGNVDLVDFASFAVCFGQPPAASNACACSDLNADGTVNLLDFATFSLLFNSASTNTPPNCP